LVNWALKNWVASLPFHRNPCTDSPGVKGAPISCGVDDAVTEMARMTKLTVLVSPSVVVNVPASVPPNDQFQIIDADAGDATPNVATRVRVAARDFTVRRDRRVTGSLLQVERMRPPYGAPASARKRRETTGRIPA